MLTARSICNYNIGKLFEDWYKTKKKQVPKSIIGKLSPISLAFWFMDDGSSNFKGIESGQHERAAFATCSFNKQSISNLVEALKYLGINTLVSNHDYNRIHFTAEEAEKLFILIAPYICPSMRYKLPKRYRNLKHSSFLNYVGKFKPDLVEQKVLSVKQREWKTNSTRYDLETETHNFIADGIVVHNSNSRVGLFDGEFIAGSHNMQLKEVVEGTTKECLYWWPLKDEKVRDLLKHFGNAILFGEIFGAGVQKLHYGLENGRKAFRAFDIFHEDHYLNWTEFESLCNRFDVSIVPIVYKGAYNFQIIHDRAQGPTIIEGATHVREGIVFKPMIERWNEQVGRVIMKHKSDEYELNANKLDNDQH